MDLAVLACMSGTKAVKKRQVFLQTKSFALSDKGQGQNLSKFYGGI
jgi:hypothetical protein